MKHSNRDTPANGATTSTETSAREHIALMVVGTPRSGTTLVQRLVADHCGLATVPETHMFTVFAPRLLRQAAFPLDGEDLRSAIDLYTNLPQHRGGAPAPGALYDRLDGRAHDLAEFFAAVIADLSNDATDVVEKTPDHLLWLHLLAPLLPTTKFVAVVRDPRAVFASTTKVHWGQRKAVKSAHRWARDQQHLLKTQQQLGADRLLLIRYEDLVVNEAKSAEQLKLFLGRTGDSNKPTIEEVFRPHEQLWKGRVGEPVTAERVAAWQAALPADDVARIEAICKNEMATFGYELAQKPVHRLTLQDQGDRLRYSVRRVAHEARINKSYARRAGLR